MTTTTTKNYHLTFFKSMFDNRVELGEDYTWAELVETFGTHRRTDQKNDLGFIIGSFKPVGEGREAKAPGGDPHVTIPNTVGRYGENIVEMGALCIDYDGGVTIEEVREQLADFTHLGYTSYNHLKDGSTHKFRVIIPFTTPCPAEEWKRRHRNFMPLFAGADLSTFMLARIFYAPSTPASEERVTMCWSNEGETFDWNDVEVEAVKQHVPRPVGTFDTVTTTELPYIRTPKWGDERADMLFGRMTEGYDHKQACFRMGDYSDKKAGCFVIKRPTGLSYHGTDGANQFIKIVSTDPAPMVFKPKAVSTGTTLIDTLRARVKATPVKETLIFADQPTIYELDERYLSPEILQAFPDRGVIAIRSPKGSGKTERLSNLVALNKTKNASTLLIGHRIHLLRNLSERTGLGNYQDMDDGTLGAFAAVCLNSLGTRRPAHGDHYDTIIIDESEQVLQALVGDHLSNVRNETYIAFADYIKHARLVVLLDADLTAGLSIEVMRLLRDKDAHEDDAVGIINSYPIGNGRVTKMYEDRHHLLGDALVDVAAGEKVYYACNSINRATTTARTMESLGKKVLLVTSETGERDAVKAFIASPASEAIKYDALVTSPTLSTGISIDAHDGIHHFTRVYGEFGLNPGTFLDADQAISRVRDESVTHCVWIQANNPKSNIAAKSEVDILDDYIARHRLSSLALPGTQIQLTPQQYKWALLCATIEARVSEWSIYKPQQFRAARSAIGWTVETVLCDKEAAVSGKNAYDQHKPLTDGHAENVVTATQITSTEYNEIAPKKVKTTAEGLSMERYRYELELTKIGREFNLENVTAAISQNLISSLRFARTHIIKSHDNRIVSDTESREKNKVTFTDTRHDVKKNEVLIYLCSAAGLNFAALHTAALAAPVEISAETLSKVALAFVARQRECNLFFGCRIKDPTHPQSLAKVWNATIGSRTLPLASKRLTVEGVKVRKHFIDSKAVDMVLEVLDYDLTSRI